MGSKTKTTRTKRGNCENASFPKEGAKQPGRVIKNRKSSEELLTKENAGRINTQLVLTKKEKQLSGEESVTCLD